MKGIRITSKKDGFRRAGVAHHGTVDHALDAFTRGQLAALRAEPNLIVTDVDPPDAQADEKAVRWPTQRHGIWRIGSAMWSCARSRTGTMTAWSMPPWWTRRWPTPRRRSSAKALRFKIGKRWITARRVTIPARPFLGIDPADQAEIIAILRDHIARFDRKA